MEASFSETIDVGPRVSSHIDTTEPSLEIPECP